MILWNKALNRFLYFFPTLLIKVRLLESTWTTLPLKNTYFFFSFFFTSPDPEQEKRVLPSLLEEVSPADHLNKCSLTLVTQCCCIAGYFSVLEGISSGETWHYCVVSDAIVIRLRGDTLVKDYSGEGPPFCKEHFFLKPLCSYFILMWPYAVDRMSRNNFNPWPGTTSLSRPLFLHFGLALNMWLRVYVVISVSSAQSAESIHTWPKLWHCDFLGRCI